jgi:NAD-dependent SIR2 family protein deacetylase
MVVKTLLCQMCGQSFEAEVLDREDSRERDRPGNPVTCPQCHSPRLEVIRTLHRVRSAG